MACVPSPLTLTVNGDVEVEVWSGPPSIWYDVTARPEPGAGSDGVMVTTVSPKYQPFAPDVPELTAAEVVGAVVSDVHAQELLAAPIFPATSIARISKL